MRSRGIHHGGLKVNRLQESGLPSLISECPTGKAMIKSKVTLETHSPLLHGELPTCAYEHFHFMCSWQCPQYSPTKLTNIYMYFQLVGTSKFFCEKNVSYLRERVCACVMESDHLSCRKDRGRSRHSVIRITSEGLDPSPDPEIMT